MSVSFTGLFVLVMMLIVLLSGVQIGVGLMMTAFLGVLLSTGRLAVAVSLFGGSAYSAIMNYAFAVVPLFVMVGLLANIAGASTELYDTASVMMRKLRGGVAIATVFANAVFAAITGVSIASAAVFSKIALPEMNHLGYDIKFSTGTIAGSSVLGMLIPPSMLMIIYGTLAEESIGKLFLGGIIPGIILSLIYMVTILIMAYTKPGYVGLDRSGKPINQATTKNLGQELGLKVLFKPWGIILLIIITMGGIWGGFFTPTEAGGVGVVGAFLLAVAKRKMNWKALMNALLDTGKTTGSVLFILIAAQMFSRMLAMSGLINMATRKIMSFDLAPLAIVIIFCLIHLVLGCVLDSTSILLLTMPIMVPIIRQLGFNTVWYGILAIIVIEIGLITPPFGMSVFTIKSALANMRLSRPVSTEDIFLGSIPFMFGMVVLVVLIIAFPKIVMFLPSTMLE